MNEEKLEESGFELIPEELRVNLIDKDCPHANATVLVERPDGLKDCYCSKCGQGGIFNSLNEFKAS